jgi:hypothetical protein
MLVVRPWPLHDQKQTSNQTVLDDYHVDCMVFIVNLNLPFGSTDGNISAPHYPLNFGLD